MTMHLDLPTLMVVSALASVGIALGFTLILLLLPREPVLQMWTAGLWLVALALGLFGARQLLPLTFSILAVHACLVGAHVLLIRGVAVHTGHRLRWRWLLSAAVAYELGVALSTLVWPGMRLRDLEFSLLMVASDACIAGLLLSCRASDIRRSCRLAAAVFACHAALYLVRMMALPPEGQGHQAIPQAGLPLASLYVILLLLMLAKCFAMVLLIIERLMAGLQRLARRDGLTELLNRTAILAAGQQALEQARRQRRPLAVLLCDLDHFKTVNDTWGHQAGDRVLIQVAGLVHEMLSGGGHLAGRYGGEEFLLVLVDCDGPRALAMAEELRQRISTCEIRLADHVIGITTSIGVSVADGHSHFEHMVVQADTALYRSKHAGRNQVSGGAPGTA